MAQIYVNDAATKPKAINIYNSSTQMWLENKIGYVRVNGEWIPFISYSLEIYNRGVGSENIHRIAYSGGGSFEKKADYLALSAFSDDGYTRGSVTAGTGEIDLTPYTKYKAEVAFTNYNATQTNLIGIQSNVGGKPTFIWESFSHTVAVYPQTAIIELDITSFTGMGVVMISTDSFDAINELKVFRMWLEE